ncbi:hypothetical protein P22_1109 [Propionispora sp. 2/2-37]|uniref:HAMP domain-containing sensor histidine kinase n=1 Tax=Propionispora sp. 2/2-37 TaxID=1677858 RepID=UPI0006BB6FD3|nr:HAMP domain-containing sensor histidine kinase [Propionispora sp. 2/2-37]CUH95040.1 hypothetical protein P22_1109 [Propionispora sp. 2/2-37]
MKLSIRTRLFTNLTALLLFFVFLSLCLTLLGLEKYYFWQKKNVLVTAGETIDSVYLGNPEDLSLDLERLGNTLGARIIISRDGYVKYSSFGRIINEKFHELPPAPPSNAVSAVPQPPRPLSISKERESFDSRTVLEVQQDQVLKIDFLTMERQLNNGDTLLIHQPLAPMQESATVAAQFLGITGILALLLGSVWTFLFAKKFTAPILELNRIAQSMSKLNFSQKCTINRSDEIGELGSSINQLSTQLDTAISELYQKNLQLMADVEKERKLDKMRKDFVSSVSHELKTPLALILGYAEGLKENVAKDEDSRNFYSSVIIDEAGKMDKLVKDLLNLSQIESGFFPLTQTDFDLSALLNDFASKYQTLFQEKNITLEMNLPDSRIVHGDSLRIEQVLTNLLTNAIDHTDANKQVKISIQDVDDKVRIFVFNSGKPIPEESFDKLWTSFYKVDKSRSREHGGYGLGLSIVRAIQELHGNRYGVQNTPEGVSFWFEVNKTAP